MTKLYSFKTFKKSLADCNWTNPHLVGIETVSSYKDKQVILTEKTLDAFKQFMLSKSITFNYDLAIGLFE